MRLFIGALWSPAGKGLTSWLSFVISIFKFLLCIGIFGQVLYLIVSIPDHCPLSYFHLVLIILLFILFFANFTESDVCIF